MSKIAIKSQYIVDIQNGVYGFKDLNRTRKLNFIDFLQRMSDDYAKSGQKACHTLMESAIKRLIRHAGIDKKVSFHVGRHTFATLTLTYGADLYTVSKLLGHCNIRTTQIYAKIVDENKRKAVNLVPKI